MNEMSNWLKLAVELKASDIFIGVGRCVSFKIGGVITKHSDVPVNIMEIETMIAELYSLAHRPMERYLETGDDDFSISLPGLARFRVSAYQQRGTKAAIIRVVLFCLPDYHDLNIMDEVISLASLRHGLALVTGVAGSGKTTTLACIIDEINRTRNGHIITLEDPIEHLHRDNKSVISQREISTDTDSYLTALRACMRQAPDVILLGELRDHETIRTAMTAAETGNLVISTLHTVGATNTIDRIIDVFPPNQQQQIRVQLSMVLRVVVSQQLLPGISGGLLPAFEMMCQNNAIRNLIRESKIHQIDSVIQTSRADGMISMDTSIYNLYQQNKITAETAVHHSNDVQQMTKRLGL